MAERKAAREWLRKPRDSGFADPSVGNRGIGSCYTIDMRPVVLTIAGSDSGGGAGIQADLRVFARLGVFGTSVITAVTAQNLTGVTGVDGMTTDLVRAQIAAVHNGFDVWAIKTGMLWSSAIVEAVAEAIAKPRPLAEGAGSAPSESAGTTSVPLVVDPVMVATSGARLLSAEAVRAYRERLLPHAALVTPNLDEAAVLCDRDRIDSDEIFAVSDQLFDRCQCPVLLKGGHLRGDPIDILRHPGGLVAWRHARVTDVDTHGSGCMLSAAIAAHLALGHGLVLACELSLAFVHDALLRGHRLAGDITLAGIEHAQADVRRLTRISPE